MLSTIPRSLWLRYWLWHNTAKLVSWSMWLVGIAALGAYWPLRNMFIEQEKCVTIHVSNLTVAYVLFLCYMGYFFQWLTRKYLSKRSQFIRLAAMLLLMVLLLLFLDFGLGMEMRWSK